MGTDIHIKIQFRDKETGEWLYGDAFIDKPMDKWTAEWNSKDGSVESELGDRSYLRFAILGNVRNGRGFAGVYTHDPVPYISDCRGLPEDLKYPPAKSYKYFEDYQDDPDCLKAMWFGDHSFSWVTLRELMEYDYTRTLDRGGVVNLETYKKWKESGETEPDGWVGGISGGGVVVSPEDNITEKTTHVQAFWKLPLRNALSEHWFWCIEALLIEAERRGIGPEDVRLVFGFDS